MPGTLAYMVVGTTTNIKSGESLEINGDYYRAGIYLSPGAAENALARVKVPAKYMFLSVVKVEVRFYVCVDPHLDDDAMAKFARGDAKYAPSIIHGPFDNVDQAQMMCLMVDRAAWKGALVLAMTDEGSKKISRVEQK